MKESFSINERPESSGDLKDSQVDSAAGAFSEASYDEIEALGVTIDDAGGELDNRNTDARPDDPNPKNGDNYSFHYDEEGYRTKSFQTTWGALAADRGDDEKKKEQRFRDFLELPRLAGRRRSVDYSNRIPSEHIVDDGSSVEISDEYGAEQLRKHETTKIITIKNDAGDITRIVVVCTCGNKTIIDLDYDLSGARPGAGSLDDVELEASPEGIIDEFLQKTGSDTNDYE